MRGTRTRCVVTTTIVTCRGCSKFIWQFLRCKLPWLVPAQGRDQGGKLTSVVFSVDRDFSNVDLPVVNLLAEDGRAAVDLWAREGGPMFDKDAWLLVGVSYLVTLVSRQWKVPVAPG